LILSAALALSFLPVSDRLADLFALALLVLSEAEPLRRQGHEVTAGENDGPPVALVLTWA